MTIARSLWTDDASKRFYLVPDGVELPPGPLHLRAGATRHIHVDLEAAAPYEATKEEARAFLDARVGEFVGGLKGAVAELAARFGKLGQPDPSAPPSAPADATPSSPVGSRLFSGLTGVPESELREDPQAFERGLRELLERKGAAPQTPEEERELEDRAARLRQLSSEVDAAATNAFARFRSMIDALDRKKSS